MREASNVPRQRRSSRRNQPVNIEAFTDDVKAALTAFGEDVSYAVQIARGAVTIARKRAIWDARRELRAAEKRARAECETNSPFECHAVSPCGVGDCKFVGGDLGRLVVADCDGDTVRPQEHSLGGYSLEPAVEPLLQMRSTSP